MLRLLGFLLAAIGGLRLVRKTTAGARAFRLVRNAYRNVEEWAADRGKQVRASFGVKVDTLKPEGSVRASAMSADAWNAAKIGTLATHVQGRFRTFIAAVQVVARRHGAEIIIWDGARTLERQVELYKRGRTAPGTIVTHAIATVTGHIWGMAVDLIFRTPDGQPSFDWPPGSDKYPSWYFSEVLPLAKVHRLESLYVVKGIDAPHIQFPTAEATTTASAVRAIKYDFPGLG